MIAAGATTLAVMIGNRAKGKHMTLLEQALSLAAAGFHVFPLKVRSKLPAINGWQKRATRDAQQIREWWATKEYNIGICTSYFQENLSLIAVDVDNKGDKHGDEEIIKLELSGKDFPATYTQATPTGGSHILYSAENAVRNGVSVLGAGLDIRGDGGYVVAAGSVLDTGIYTGTSESVTPAPRWLLEACRRPRSNQQQHEQSAHVVDQTQAEARAVHYLTNEAPVAMPGQRNALGYMAAAKLKDFGVHRDTALLLMREHWRCEPMLEDDEVLHVVNSAYQYGQQAPGVAAPETEFPPVQNSESFTEREHPFTELNRTHAFVLAGGGHHVLWETTDVDGKPKLEHLAEASFHRAHAAKTMPVGNKVEPVTKLWMESPHRRSYKGICFQPGQQAADGWYNMWRGFAVEPNREPASKEARAAVAAWNEHLLQNVCQSNPVLADWLLKFFAHMAQKPNEKPLVGLAFQGEKGVGKNALIELGIHGLLGVHSLIVTDDRYLVGQFNGHLENLLMITFDEAFWSGDKRAEGRLKGLVTGAKHTIEHKGKEPYVVDNKCRVVVLGNADWLVPATPDERRFAVFTVGDGRKQDRNFFEGMRRGMAAGGFQLLLGQLLDVDISTFDPNAAPATEALIEQKHASLDAFHQWWHECLAAGQLVGGDFSADWPREVDKPRLRAAFSRYVKERGLGRFNPGDIGIGKALMKCAPTARANQKRRDGTALVNVYRFNTLEAHRREWEEFIGGSVKWD
jgi:hypothetical protein